MKVKSYAKINLYLDVISKRSDGYHNIITVMNEVDLYDDMVFEKAQDFHIESDVEIEDNIIEKVYNIVKKKYNIGGIKVKLKKRIPMGGGLGGGSSNACETLKALDKLYDLDISKQEYKNILNQVGSDCYYFYEGSTKLCYNAGGDIKDMPKVGKLFVLILNDGTMISSAEVYKNMRISYEHLSEDEVVSAFKNKESMLLNMKNSMEDYVFEKYKNLKAAKDDLYSTYPLKALMSGSGASLFALYENKKDLDAAYDKLNGKYKILIKTELI